MSYLKQIVYLSRNQKRIFSEIQDSFDSFQALVKYISLVTISRVILLKYISLVTISRVSLLKYISLVIISRVILLKYISLVIISRVILLNPYRPDAGSAVNKIR